MPSMAGILSKMEWGGGVNDSVDALDRFIEGTLLGEETLVPIRMLEMNCDVCQNNSGGLR